MFDVGFRLAVAGLVGLAVGLEREWSGHASGPGARFAGVRTFLLLGLIGGMAGWTVDLGLTAVGIPLLVVAGSLVVVAYALAAHRTGDVEATTEVAALAIVMLGAVAGLGYLEVASGVTAVMVLALREKDTIRAFVRRIGEPELRAAFQFAVLALVILPILPEGPYGPFGGIRPRTLWAVVLIFSGVNYLGYLARKAVGESRGFGIAGALGGLVSSTAVTLTFAQRSRTEPEHGTALGVGVLAACTVLVPRVAAVAWALNPVLGQTLAPALVPPLVLGVLLLLYVGRRHPGEEAEHDAPPVGNPLQLASAVRMVVAFQAILLGLEFAASRFGDTGLVGGAAVLGLTDMDGLTFSMSRMAGATVSATTAAHAILVGLVSNTLVKLAVGVGMGRGTFRRVVGLGLAVLTLATGLGVWLLVG